MTTEAEQMKAAGCGDVTLRQLQHRCETLAKERDVCRDESRKMADQLANTEAQLALARSALETVDETTIEPTRFSAVDEALASIDSVPDRMAALQAEVERLRAEVFGVAEAVGESTYIAAEVRLIVKERDALAEKLAAAEARVRELEAEQAHDNVFTGAEDEVQALRETAEVVTESLWAYDRMRERAEKAEARVRELVQRAHTMLTDKGVHPGIVGERDSAERLWERIEDHVQPARRIEFEGLRERAEKAEARAERLENAAKLVHSIAFWNADKSGNVDALYIVRTLGAALRAEEPGPAKHGAIDGIHVVTRRELPDGAVPDTTPCPNCGGTSYKLRHDVDPNYVDDESAFECRVCGNTYPHRFLFRSQAAEAPEPRSRSAYEQYRDGVMCTAHGGAAEPGPGCGPCERHEAPFAPEPPPSSEPAWTPGPTCPRCNKPTPPRGRDVSPAQGGDYCWCWPHGEPVLAAAKAAAAAASSEPAPRDESVPPPGWLIEDDCEEPGAQWWAMREDTAFPCVTRERALHESWAIYDREHGYAPSAPAGESELPSSTPSSPITSHGRRASEPR